ncbi:hypothetical protein Bbelb_098610 [Branchiostoma belcheri]|nr:hypothetical protein Bbelb_098610 [Branchiostoma belcheri]
MPPDPPRNLAPSRTPPFKILATDMNAEFRTGDETGTDLWAAGKSSGNEREDKSNKLGTRRKTFSRHVGSAKGTLFEASTLCCVPMGQNESDRFRQIRFCLAPNAWSDDWSVAMETGLRLPRRRPLPWIRQAGIDQSRRRRASRDVSPRVTGFGHAVEASPIRRRPNICLESRKPLLGGTRTPAGDLARIDARLQPPSSRRFVFSGSRKRRGFDPKRRRLATTEQCGKVTLAAPYVRRSRSRNRLFHAKLITLASDPPRSRDQELCRSRATASPAGRGLLNYRMAGDLPNDAKIRRYTTASSSLAAPPGGFGGKSDELVGGFAPRRRRGRKSGDKRRVTQKSDDIPLTAAPLGRAIFFLAGKRILSRRAAGEDRNLVTNGE